MDRKLTGLKQVERAINQLVGAAKKVSQKVDIFNTKGELISFNKELLPHCIILVSDLLPFWRLDKHNNENV